MKTLLPSEIESKSSNGKTPFSWDAEKGHVKVVERFLEKMANAESKDVEEKMSFMWAARNGHGVVNLLLKRVVNLDLADYGGQTSLSLAPESGHETVVRIFC
jgi:ankyrin repeat protein